MCVGGAREARRGRRVRGRRDKRERNISCGRTDRQLPAPGDTRDTQSGSVDWHETEGPELTGLVRGDRW